MNAQAWAAVIAGIGFVASLVGAGMIVAWRAGKTEAELRAAAQSARDIAASELRIIADRLGRIEAKFELRLKD